MEIAPEISDTTRPRKFHLLLIGLKDLEKRKKKSQSSAYAVIKPVTLTYRAAYSTSEYELRNSVLLDSAATDHVTNDSKRLTSYRSVEDEFVWSGNTKVPVLSSNNATYCKSN